MAYVRDRRTVPSEDMQRGHHPSGGLTGCNALGATRGLCTGHGGVQPVHSHYRNPIIQGAITLGSNTVHSAAN